MFTQRYNKPILRCFNVFHSKNKPVTNRSTEKVLKDSKNGYSSNHINNNNICHLNDYNQSNLCTESTEKKNNIKTIPVKFNKKKLLDSIHRNKIQMMNSPNNSPSRYLIKKINSNNSLLSCSSSQRNSPIPSQRNYSFMSDTFEQKQFNFEIPKSPITEHKKNNIKILEVNFSCTNNNLFQINTNNNHNNNNNNSNNNNNNNINNNINNNNNNVNHINSYSEYINDNNQESIVDNEDFNCNNSNNLEFDDTETNNNKQIIKQESNSEIGHNKNNEEENQLNHLYSEKKFKLKKKLKEEINDDISSIENVLNESNPISSSISCFKASKSIFTNEYLLSYQSRNVCQGNDKINPHTMNHLIEYNRVLKVYDNPKKNKNKFHHKPQLENDNKVDEKNDDDENQIEKNISIDTFKKDFIFFLNLLCVDNSKQIQDKLIDILINKNSPQTPSDKVEEIISTFVDIIVNKAIYEKLYSSLYVDLCYNVNEEFISYEKTDKTKFRKFLINKCNQIFFKDYESYELNDESTLKTELLGNSNLISKLIGKRIISKKVGFSCLDSLFKRYNLCETQENKEVFFEAIIILLSNIGQNIFISEKEKYLQKLNCAIDEDLFNILEQDDINERLRYLFLNLRAKKKDDWNETIYEKEFKAKGKQPNTFNDEEEDTPLPPLKPAPTKTLKQTSEEDEEQPENKEDKKENILYEKPMINRQMRAMTDLVNVTNYNTEPSHVSVKTELNDEIEVCVVSELKTNYYEMNRKYNGYSNNFSNNRGGMMNNSRSPTQRQSPYYNNSRNNNYSNNFTYTNSGSPNPYRNTNSGSPNPYKNKVYNKKGYRYYK